MGGGGGGGGGGGDSKTSVLPNAQSSQLASYNYKKVGRVPSCRLSHLVLPHPRRRKHLPSLF